MKARVPVRHAKSASERVFRALASRARLRIVKELSAAEELPVSDLVGCCGLGWPTVSHHLGVLRAAGIVADEKRGQHVYYRLVLPCVTRLIRCLEEAGCEDGVPRGSGGDRSISGARGGVR